MLRTILLALILTSSAPVTAAVATDVEPGGDGCRWHAELSDTLDQLGADTTRWRIADVRLYGLVDYGEQVARIDPGTPCQFVRDTAIHEWVHLQQARRYGGSGGVYARYGSSDEAERVADCAARALGSDTTLYVDPSWGFNYVGPCTDADEVEVRRLITYRGGGR